ncbi:MAG: hypothetical protein ACOX1U_02235 [Saccharofermentanales bacterium]|jgi:hypothetical protein|nr:hypothetical protein [Syntrophorhabdaceae bacterium]
MKTKQIWERANEHRELIRSLYRALCEGEDINGMMNQLKQLIPCLFGVDADRRALVFRSIDDGLVALLVKEEGDTLVLALATTDIELN